MSTLQSLDTWLANVDLNRLGPASISVNGTTLAGHANHVCSHMWGTNEFLKNGIYPKMDWPKSWEPISVDENGWVEIQAKLRSEYLKLIAALDVAEWDQPMANEEVASLAHLAYVCSRQQTDLAAQSAGNLR